MLLGESRVAVWWCTVLSVGIYSRTKRAANFAADCFPRKKVLVAYVAFAPSSCANDGNVELLQSRRIRAVTAVGRSRALKLSQIEAGREPRR